MPTYLTRSFIALLICLLLPFAWAADGGPDDGVEASYALIRSSGYKAVGNVRFNFFFDIPGGWRAFDRSANGDGYFIDVGEPEVDLRAYGSYFDDRERLEKATRFRFSDGKLGWYVAEVDTVKYVRMEGDAFIYLDVQAPRAWRDKNADVLSHVGASLRPGKSAGARILNR